MPIALPSLPIPPPVVTEPDPRFGGMTAEKAEALQKKRFG